MDPQRNCATPNLTDRERYDWPVPGTLHGGCQERKAKGQRPAAPARKGSKRNEDRVIPVIMASSLDMLVSKNCFYKLDDLSSALVSSILAISEHVNLRDPIPTTVGYDPYLLLLCRCFGTVSRNRNGSIYPTISCVEEQKAFSSISFTHCVPSHAFCIVGETAFEEPESLARTHLTCHGTHRYIMIGTQCTIRIRVPRIH